MKNTLPDIKVGIGKSLPNERNSVVKAHGDEKRDVSETKLSIMNTRQNGYGSKEKNAAGRMRLERKRLRLSGMLHAIAQLLLRKVTNVFQAVNGIAPSCR